MRRAWDDVGVPASNGFVTGNLIHHPKVRAGAAIFEEGDEGECALGGAAGSRLRRAKEALVKHEENMAACRHAAATRAQSVDSALPRPCVRDEPAFGRVGARGSSFMIVPARACVSPKPSTPKPPSLSAAPHSLHC